MKQALDAGSLGSYAMFMPKGKTEKRCRCGRGTILTGERAKYNAKDAKGRMICSECFIEDLISPYNDRKECG